MTSEGGQRRCRACVRAYGSKGKREGLPNNDTNSSKHIRHGIRPETHSLSLILSTLKYYFKLFSERAIT